MRNRVTAIALSIPLLAVSACAPSSNADQDLACAGGVFSGAAVGGFVGNQFGQGTGRNVMTAAGAIAGGAAGASAAC